ncbi:rhomboid family intramembrane serine protease [Maribacter sp. IgM3_T14_3]|uniref:rhomboid family intramembrane serine protease n=1 Tax=Maribacter sp. IgM3_T14_3 TaxID=3415140 RepID=UPI003C6F0818
MYNIDIATIAIIAANVLVSMKGFSDTTFFERYKFSIGAIKAGQKERMATSGFLHVDISHLLFNMLTLYFFADVVIAWLGVTQFIIVYLVSLFGGSLLALYFHKDEPYYSAVGASGAVMGIVYSVVLLQPFSPFYGFIPAFVFGIGYLLYSIYGMKKRLGNIGHTAHFGGAIGGYVCTLIFMPSLLQTDTLMVGLLALPIVLLLVLEKMGKI